MQYSWICTLVLYFLRLVKIQTHTRAISSHIAFSAITVQRETFEGENYCKLVKNNFPKKVLLRQRTPSPQILNDHKTVKFAGVFSLKSFPLYSVCVYIYIYIYQRNSAIKLTSVGLATINMPLYARQKRYA